MPRIVISLVLLSGAALGWLAWSQSRAAPLVVSGFVEADEVRVGSRVGGRVAEVLVREGDAVKQGAVLYRMDPFNLKEQLAQAFSERAAAEAELAEFKAGYRKEEIDQAKAQRDQLAATVDRLVAGPRPAEVQIAREQVKIAAATLELARAEHDRLTRLREGAQAAQKEIDESVRALKAGEAGLAAAEQQLALLEEGTRKEEIAEARAALAKAEHALQLLEKGFRTEDIARAAAEVDAAAAHVRTIEKQIEELTVLSPCDCVVETLDLRPGDLAAANAPSVALLDLARMWVRAYVPEGRLGEVQLGREIPVRIDSFPNRTFHGRVTFIAREAEFTPRNVQTPEERSKQVFRIKVTLLEGIDQIRVGMAADVLLGEKSGA